MKPLILVPPRNMSRRSVLSTYFTVATAEQIARNNDHECNFVAPDGGVETQNEVEMVDDDMSDPLEVEVIDVDALPTADLELDPILS